MRPDEWINTGDELDLRVSCSILSPSGWMDLNDGRRYTLEGSALAQQAQTFRRVEVSNNHTPGSYLVSAQPENVVEQVSLWVREFDHYALQMALNELREAFTQTYYLMRWQIEQHEFAWQCQLADFTITAQREFRHATMAKFDAKVPRHPTQVDGLAGMLPRRPGSLI